MWTSGVIYKSQFTWPEDYTPIDGKLCLNHMTDLQKLYCLIISKKQWNKCEVANELGGLVLLFLLHVILTMDVVLIKLQNLKDSDWQKTKIGLRDNTIRCLLVLKDCPITMKKIYEFAKINLICWRKAATSINSHLYNADAICLLLSTDRDNTIEVEKILHLYAVWAIHLHAHNYAVLILTSLHLLSNLLLYKGCFAPLFSDTYATMHYVVVRCVRKGRHFSLA